MDKFTDFPTMSVDERQGWVSQAAGFTPEQQDLLAEVLEACSDTESCELEAMFLAAMDLTLSLLCRPHFRRMAEK